MSCEEQAPIHTFHRTSRTALLFPFHACISQRWLSIFLFILSLWDVGGSGHKTGAGWGQGFYRCIVAGQTHRRASCYRFFSLFVFGLPKD